MSEKAFRLDFFIAIAALIVSVLTTATLVYQTHVISAQYSATIWPYLTVEATYDVHTIAIDLDNDGLGPALVKSARLKVDGTPVTGWVQFFQTLAQRDPVLRAALIKSREQVLTHHATPLRIEASSIGPGSTIRPSEQRQLLKVTLPSSVPASRLASSVISAEFCYCSLDQRCWTLNTVLGQDDTSVPVPASSCEHADRITSDFVTVK